MKKRTLSALILSAAVLLQSSPVSATNYTSTDSSKNSYYNRGEAVNYINNFAVSPNLDYATYFGELGGDCTNFVSQVVLAGGMSKLGTNPDANSSWFYNGPNLPSRSTSWTGVNYFRKHWGNYNGEGYNRCYSYKEYTVDMALRYWNETIWQDLWQGDIVQHADSANYGTHSQAIQGFEPNNEILFAQHSTSLSGCYRNGNLRDYLSGRPLNARFITIQIKSGY